MSFLPNNVVRTTMFQDNIRLRIVQCEIIKDKIELYAAKWVEFSETFKTNYNTKHVTKRIRHWVGKIYTSNDFFVVRFPHP